MLQRLLGLWITVNVMSLLTYILHNHSLRIWLGFMRAGAQKHLLVAQERAVIQSALRREVMRRQQTIRSGGSSAVWDEVSGDI